ncbi:hypothetical protein [Herbaspirillum sp. B65]|uniref:hypothetical protein n=1 Tax=Herbaspirillum sp. B65 TaxID=137708 RepID=UPI0011D2A144|nr:hypothetical protein [Herbaspirillum sp. B65]
MRAVLRWYPVHVASYGFFLPGGGAHRVAMLPAVLLCRGWQPASNFLCSEREMKKSCTAALFSDFTVLFSHPRKRLRTDNGVYLGQVHT